MRIICRASWFMHCVFAYCVSRYVFRAFDVVYYMCMPCHVCCALCVCVYIYCGVTLLIRCVLCVVCVVVRTLCVELLVCAVYVV